MNGYLAAFRRAIPELSRVCRKALLVLAAFATLCAAMFAPALFGFRPFVVAESDHAAYPVGALAYYRYTAAETLESGTSIAARKASGTAVCTVSDMAEDGRALTVFSSAETGEVLPVEFVEGAMAPFCLPYMGVVLQTLVQPPVIWLWILPICVFVFGGLILPRWSYKPKYGRKDGNGDAADS